MCVNKRNSKQTILPLPNAYSSKCMYLFTRLAYVKDRVMKTIVLCFDALWLYLRCRLVWFGLVWFDLLSIRNRRALVAVARIVCGPYGGLPVPSVNQILRIARDWFMASACPE